MSANNSATASAYRVVPTFTYNFCDNTKVKGVKTVVVNGHMREPSPFQRAKLISSESRVCIAYRHDQQLLVLKEDVNADILYHFRPQLRDFYTCCKETGLTILLPDTEQFSLVSALGIQWVIGSFMHEMSEGHVPFFGEYVCSKTGRDPRQLFHAAATFRAFCLPWSVRDLVLPNNGLIAQTLRETAWDTKSPRHVGELLRYLKNDPLICEVDQILLVGAYKIFARRNEGYNRKKTSTGDEFVKNK